MTDFIIWKVFAHYVPQDYYPPIMMVMTCLIGLEQWLASTNKIKANSTLQAIINFVQYLFDKMKGNSNG